MRQEHPVSIHSPQFECQNQNQRAVRTRPSSMSALCRPAQPITSPTIPNLCMTFVESWSCKRQTAAWAGSTVAFFALFYATRTPSELLLMPSTEPTSPCPGWYLPDCDQQLISSFQALRHKLIQTILSSPKSTLWLDGRHYCLQVISQTLLPSM